VPTWFLFSMLVTRYHVQIAGNIARQVGKIVHMEDGIIPHIACP